MNEEFIIRKLLKSKIKGVDNYKHNGSTWLIFTSEQKWVIELTPQGTLWYNFYFFSEIFNFVGLDVVENQHYITKWVEDTIQNGVKDILKQQVTSTQIIENTIQNGVKETILALTPNSFELDDTIQNGIKETIYNPFEGGLAMEEAIQNGVKRTELGGKDRKIDEIKDIVENGVKETTPGGYLGSVEVRGTTVHQFETAKQLYYVEDVIEYGIKKTEGAMLFDESQIDTVISDGIKEVQPLPSQEGNNDWGNYYHRQEDRTKPHTKYVDDVVRDGVKETSWRKVDNYPAYTDYVIERGEKC